MTTPGFRPAALLLAAAVLAGCSSFSADGGFGPVQQTARERLGKDLVVAKTDADRDLIAQRVAELLAKPLTADDAVQIALLNNRGLQATFQELGITEAELVQAGRLPNPGFSFGRLTRGSEVEIERGLHFNLARLLAMPMISELENRRFAQTQGAVAMKVLCLAADTRKAWVHGRRRRGDGALHAAGDAGRRSQRRAGAAHGSRWATSTSCSARASRASTPTRR